MALRFFVAVLLAVLALSPAYAQEDREERSALLPDIDSQDIEIRGDFRARFTGISRQPILGFSPTPRVFRIDPDRLPFMETPEEVVASLPLSDLEPQLGPPRDLKEYPSESRVFGYAGFGNYSSPEASLYAGIPLSERTRLSLNAEHLSSEGHFDEGDINGAFRRLGGDVNLRSRLTQTGTLVFSARGRSDFSENPERWVFNPGDDMTTIINQETNTSRTTLDGFGTSAGWRSQQSVFDRYSIFAHYDFTRAGSRSTTPVTLSADDIYEFLFESEADEHRFGISADYSFAASRIGHVFSFELEADGALYDRSMYALAHSATQPVERNPAGLTETGEEWFTGGLGAYWQRELNSGNRIKVGGRFFGGYDAEQDVTLAGFPYASFKLRSTGPLKLNAELSGYMKNRGLEQVYSRNSLVGMSNSLINERTFYGDVQLEYEPVRGLAFQGGFYASWTERPFMYFNNATSDYGFSSWMYPEDLLLMRPSAGVTYNLSPRLLMVYAEAHANFTYMSEPIIEGTDFDTFSGMEAYRITGGFRTTPFEHAVFKVWADYIGPREELVLSSEPDSSGNLDFSYTDEPGNALLLNVQAEYRIGGRVGFYIKALNLLNETYEIWSGYEERPLQIFGGVTFNF